MISRLKNKRQFFIFLILLVLLVGLFLALRWNSFTMPFERDEGEYAYSAWLLKNGRLPYRDAFMQKPPVIIYLYYLAELINPSALWPARLLAAVFAALATLFFALFARREIGKGAGWVTAFIMTPMIMMPQLMSFAANTEVFLLLPLALILYFYSLDKEKFRWWHWLAAGFSVSFALLLKPICLYLILFIYLVWCYSAWKKTRSFKFVLKNLIVSLAGAVGLALLILLPFLIKDSARSFWECVIRYNLVYSKSHLFGLAALWEKTKIFFINWWFLFIFLIYFIVRRPKGWWFLLGLFLTALLGAATSWIGHYYIFVLPFWALIISASLLELTKIKLIQSQHRKILLVIFTGIVVFLMLLAARQQFFKSPKELNWWVYGSANPFVEAVDAGQSLSKLTQSEEMVLVAGSEPEILYYAKRLSSTRFVIIYPLSLETSKAKQYQKEAIDEINQNPPRAIVLVRRQSTGLIPDPGAGYDFVNYLSDKLQKDYSPMSGFIWDNENQGHFEDPISEKAIDRATIIIFKLKQNAP